MALVHKCDRCEQTSDPITARDGDGVRVDPPDGWCTVERADKSGTPMVRVICAACSEELTLWFQRRTRRSPRQKPTS